MLDLLSPEIITFLLSYLPLASFIIGLTGPDDVLIFFAILSGSGVVSFWKVFVFGLIGMITIDSLIFNIVKIKALNKKIDKIKKSKKYVPFKRFLDKFDHRNPFIFLLINRFFYGLRTISIIRLSRKKIKFSKFLVYDLLALLSWCLLMLTCGWLAGRGFTIALHLIKDIRSILGIGILLLLALYLLEALVKRKILRNQ